MPTVVRDLVLARCWLLHGTLVSGGKDRHIILWDTENGKPMRTLRGHLDEVVAVACSADGGLIASASADKSVLVWERSPVAAAAAEELRAIHAVSTGHESVLLLKQNGQVIAKSVSTGEESMVADTGVGTYQIASSSDGKRMASVNARSGIRQYDLETGEALELYWKLPGAVSAIRFHPDGKRLAWVGEFNDIILSNGEVRVWEPTRGFELATLDGPKARITSLAFCDNGSRIVATCRDGSAWS